MLQVGFTEARLEDVDLSKTQPCTYFVYMDLGTTQTALNKLKHFLTAIICWHK